MRPELILLHGTKNTDPGDIELIGMYDTRKPDEHWIMINRGLDRVCWWAEEVPEVIFFHFSISQEI